MHNYIDLERRFVDRPKYDPNELIAAEVSGKRLDWEKVLANRFSLIVAPANSGKTTEMSQRAAQMREDKGAAFFIALRKVAERGRLELALEAADLEVFKAWSLSPTTSLTVFVDSLDEALAGKQDSIEFLIRDVAERLSWPNAHVRWVISTRPAVLTADVIAQLTSVLVTPILMASSSVSGSSTTITAGKTTTQPIANGATAETEKLCVYSMLPLDLKQAYIYLTRKYSSLNADLLLQVARERGLAGFTTSPGGLDVIAQIDLITRPPESLTDVFHRVVEAVQGLQHLDHRVEIAGNPSPAALIQAAQKLASASQVCQLPNIEIPEEKLAVTEGVLSARLIANSILSEKALRQILNSQLFIDVGHHQVKLYPDELPPFLAAQRLSGQVHSPEHAHKLVEAFSWRSPTGEQGVYRQFLPLMGWLATLNQHCREEILERDPQAVAFFGDLRNSSMPLSAAKTALRESIRRLAEQGDRLGRDHFFLTPENFWQAGRDELRSLLQELYENYEYHFRARSALLNIATSARTDALRDAVLKAHGGDYKRLVLQSIDVHYLLELGLAVDLGGLADALRVKADIEEAMVATLINRLGWSHLTPTELANLINTQFKRGRGGYHLSYTLGAGLLDKASDQQLFAFSRSLVLRVARLRNRQGGLTRHRDRTDDQYVELTTEVLAAMVSRESFAEYRQVSLLCIIMQRTIKDAFFGTCDISNLRQALNKNTPVRRSFLSLIVKHTGQDTQKLWDYVFGYGKICSFDAADVEATNDAVLTTQYKEQEARQATQQKILHRVPEAKEERFKIGAQVRKELMGMLEQLRDGSATDGLAWTAAWLLQTNPNSRYGEVHINVLEREAGHKIAQAIRAGFSKVWRSRQPTCKEDEPRTTYQITVAGLQGLHFDLDEGTNLPQLTEGEVRNALRYGVFEINGYPKWFWPLVRHHEKVAGQELFQMVDQAGMGAVSLEHAKNLLASLEDAPQSVQIKLAALAWKFILNQPKIEDYLLERLLKAATEISGGPPQAELEDIARKKLDVAFTGPVPKGVEQAEQLLAMRKKSIIWASTWLTRHPSSFRKMLEKWLKKSTKKARAFIFELAAYLGNDRESRLNRLAQETDKGVALLGALYQWILEAVPPEKDTDHSDGEVYSPDSRDRAAQFRDALIPAIAAARSQLAYEMLDSLRQTATGWRAMYLKSVQFEMREKQFARTPLAQQNYNDFERNFITDVTDTTSFAMAVHSDLLTVKYDIEKGEYSLRRFFSELNFSGLSSDESILALEADFQCLLASEMNHHSKGRYSVTVEPHTAEAKRRDVLCSKGNMFASIELKMTKHWSLQMYIDALEKQLVEQYMRHRNATTGFLVIVLQNSGRKWKNPETNKMVDFNGLLDILRDKALALESRDRTRYLRVIGIDAVPPKSFRAAGENSAKKRDKSAVTNSAAVSKKKGGAK